LPLPQCAEPVDESCSGTFRAPQLEPPESIIHSGLWLRRSPPFDSASKVIVAARSREAGVWSGVEVPSASASLLPWFLKTQDDVAKKGAALPMAMTADLE
jgi:hypothetical protein